MLRGKWLYLPRLLKNESKQDLHQKTIEKLDNEKTLTLFPKKLNLEKRLV